MQDRAVKQSETAIARKQSRNRSNHSRHALKCAICNHPNRAAIEFDFLNWRNPADLVKSYHFRGLSTIYRHAHATGLLAKRRLNLRFAMERIVERVNEVPVTANAVIRAARAISRINDSGEWVDPPSRLIVTHTDRLENCEAPSIAHAESSRAPGRRDTTKITAGSARSSLRASRASRLSRDISAREGLAVSRAPVIFDNELLDEPSDSASAELPRIEGKPAPPEVILELTPEFARCREERNRAIEADRHARAAVAAPIGQLPASGNGRPESESFVGRGGTCPDRSVGNRDINAGSSPSSLLPQAAFPNSASSVLPQRTGFENNVADNKEDVASPSSTLPEAAPDKPATAKQSPRAAGPPLGPSGSCDPPFPFTPELSRRWVSRRRF